VEEDIELLNNILPLSDCGNMDHYRWKYFENPYGNSITTKSVLGGKVIARTGLIPQVVEMADERTAMIGLSVDSAAHQDHRKFGPIADCFWDMMVQAREKGISLVYGMPNENLYPLAVTCFEFHPLYSFQPLIYVPPIIDDDLPLVKIFMSSVTVPCNMLARMIRHHERKRISTKKGWTHLGQMKCLDSHILKTDDYINWRYVQCPTREYIPIQVTEKDEPTKGMAIFRKMKIHGINMLFTADIFLRKDRVMPRKDTAMWLSSISESFHTPLVFFANNDITFRALQNEGFLPVPEKIMKRQFKVVGKDLNSTALWAFRKLRFSLGDFDVI